MNRHGFTGEFLVQWLGCFWQRSSVRRIPPLLRGRDVSNGAVQAGVAIPVDPFQGFPFDLTNRLSGAEALDALGLEQADDAFSEGVVVGIALTC
jgi:hypothetical protein